MKVVSILLVEDDELDAISIRRTFDRMKIIYNMQVAKNGAEALYHLKSLSQQGSTALPDFVLMDINMPKMNGLELLNIIRRSEDLKHLKCFIVTTSEESSEKTQAQDLGISGYIIKPLALTNNLSMDFFNLMIDVMNQGASK